MAEIKKASRGKQPELLTVEIARLEKIVATSDPVFLSKIGSITVENNIDNTKLRGEMDIAGVS